jgi:alkylation response protein AidB-like acyl-CoA dehydrogenase
MNVFEALLSEASRLGQAVGKRWQEADRLCRLPDDLYSEALRARLCRTLVPIRLGGLERSAVEWFRLGVELSRRDPSFGWVLTQGAVELGWIAAGGEGSWAAEVLADECAGAATSIAGSGQLDIDGSTAVLSGRWAFNTGANTATWVGGPATVVVEPSTDGADAVRFAYVPATRADIVDDWDPVGLRGTDSCTTIVKQQVIETAWTFRPFSPSSIDCGPYRTLLGNGNWPIATSVSSTLLGCARCAIDEVVALVDTKVSAPDFVPLAQHATAQRSIASAEGRWQACVASVERELEAMWAEATMHEELTDGQRLRLFQANATAAEQAMSIIDDMCSLAGTGAIRRDQKLSRVRLDASALHAHRAVSGMALETAGKIQLGIIARHGRI